MLVQATTLVSLLFIYMIPIACKITNFPYTCIIQYGSTIYRDHEGFGDFGLKLSPQNQLDIYFLTLQEYWLGIAKPKMSQASFWYCYITHNFTHFSLTIDLGIRSQKKLDNIIVATSCCQMKRSSQLLNAKICNTDYITTNMIAQLNFYFKGVFQFTEIYLPQALVQMQQYL